MGQTTSAAVPTSGNSFGRRLSFRASMRRRRMPRLMLRSRTLTGTGGRSSELSEAFNMIADDFQVDLLNINEATEEQLMTLPGIGRRTAQGICDYRRAIGQFRKVEDLAIVSGVGAAKLATIRSEISVTSRRHRTKSKASASTTTSAAPPGALIRSASCGIVPRVHDDSSTLGRTGSANSLNEKDVGGPVDLNAASMFQLMSIRGISQEMAANIVHYREKKGRFRSIDDLAKVRGFNGRILGEYKSYLTVDPDRTAGAFSKCNKSALNNDCLKRREFSHRRSSSVPVPSHVTSNGFKLDVIDASPDADDPGAVDESLILTSPIEVHEALAAKSHRQPIVERFAFVRGDKPALRLATWNLDRFDDEKSSNLGVIEVICLTILESGVSLMALQELSSRQVLEKVCQEMNNPSLKKVRDWIGARGSWECVTTSVPSNSESKENAADQHQLGFLFDASRGIEVIKCETIDQASLNRKTNNYSVGRTSAAAAAAFSVTFKMDAFVICLLCVHVNQLLNEALTNDLNSVNDAMVAVLNAWQQMVKGASLLLVVGDFKHDSSSKELKVLKERRFTNLIPSHKDNIWINTSVKKHFTGHCKVVSNGLTHLAIPKGRWSLGGSASAHCPVWAEFYVPSALDHSKNPKCNGDVLITKNGNANNS